MEIVNVGYGNAVPTKRIIALVSPDSSPVKRMVREARDRGVLVDSTFGRKTRAVLVMDSQHVILSSLSPEAIAGRLRDDRN